MSTRRLTTRAALVVMLHGMLLYLAVDSLKRLDLATTDPYKYNYKYYVVIGSVIIAVPLLVGMAVAVPATLVGVITVVVSLAFLGMPIDRLVIEARKVAKEISGYQLGGALLKEGKAIATICVVLGYFVFATRSLGHD